MYFGLSHINCCALISSNELWCHPVQRRGPVICFRRKWSSTTQQNKSEKAIWMHVKQLFSGLLTDLFWSCYQIWIKWEKNKISSDLSNLSPSLCLFYTPSLAFFPSSSSSYAREQVALSQLAVAMVTHHSSSSLVPPKKKEELQAAVTKRWRERWRSDEDDRGQKMHTVRYTMEE